MPDQITVAEFVAETNEDYKSPTASNFTTRMSHCRNTVAALEEVSDWWDWGTTPPPPQYYTIMQPSTCQLNIMIYFLYIYI